MTLFFKNGRNSGHLGVRNVCNPWLNHDLHSLLAHSPFGMSSYNKRSEPPKLKQMAPYSRPNNLVCWQMAGCAVQRCTGPRDLSLYEHVRGLGGRNDAIYLFYDKKA